MTLLRKCSTPVPSAPHWRRYNSQFLILLLLSSLSACAASDAQTGGGKQSGKGSGPVPVVSTKATRENVPVTVQTTGTVQAYSTVNVTAQVGGQLTGVYFQEGQLVNKGDLLFEVDPRSLKSTVAQSVANQNKAQAQLAQAQAQLSQSKTQVQQAQATVAKDKAQTNYAKAEVQRYQSLVAQGAVSQEQVGQYQANAIAQQATLSADQSAVGTAMAAVESARANVQSVQSALSAAASQVESDKLQLDYTDIHAPVSGRLGQLNVNEGNLITANSATPLVTISQVNPIYVQFSIPQSQLSEVKKYQAEGNLQVEASNAQGSGSSERGSLVFLDSSVNATTGTLLVKAAFPNEDGGLTPGEFVNVSLKLTTDTNAVVVPTTAVQPGQSGSFVYVVKPNETVAVRPVTTGQVVGDQTQIDAGLQVGDRIVVDGQFNLKPGAKVKEKTAKDSTSSQPQTKPGKSSGQPSNNSSGQSSNPFIAPVPNSTSNPNKRSNNPAKNSANAPQT